MAIEMFAPSSANMNLIVVSVYRKDRFQAKDQKDEGV